MNTPWPPSRPDANVERRTPAIPGREDDIEVWVVEDNRFLRQTIAELLDGQEGVRCGLAAESVEDALGALDRGEVPQVVLMDLGLPGLSGIEGIRILRKRTPASHVVVLTVREDDDAVFDALCAGAAGYLLKPATGDKILGAVATAVQGGAPMNATIARKVLTMFTRFAQPRGDYGLTDREREILQLLCDEITQREIAEALFLSPHTVDTHLRNIYGKLHVHSRSAAVVKALREGLI